MKLTIIQTPDYILGVDKETKPEETDFYYDSKQEAIRYGTNNCVAGGYKWKIIAHTPLNDKESLEGVPLLPEIENWEELYQKNGIALQDERNKLLFRKGYEAAGGYREEDMVKAIKYGYNQSEEGLPKWFDKLKDIPDFIKLLKPFPTEFEVEMIPTCSECLGLPMRCKCIESKYEGDDCKYLVPKIVNNIIQGKYIYK